MARKFEIYSGADNILRTIEATNYRLHDGYFDFTLGDRKVLTISAVSVAVIEEVQEEK